MPRLGFSPPPFLLSPCREEVEVEDEVEDHNHDDDEGGNGVEVEKLFLP